MIKIFKVTMLLFSLIILTSCKQSSENKNIQVYTRDTSSGTREAFFTAIDFKEASKDDSLLASNALIVDGNGDMINKIKNDKNSIGYISLSSYKPNDLKALNIDDVEPTNENVLNASYKLTRNFNYIITKNSETDADKLAIAFNAYLKTIDAKLIIKSKGGIVNIEDTLLKWEDIKENYPITLKDNSKTILRFGGSTSVEPIAKALSIDFSMKSGDVLVEHNYTGSSAAYRGTQGIDSNSNSLLHVGFLSRELTKDEIPEDNTFGVLNYDAIVLVVNKVNELVNINLLDIKEIYKGTKKSFDEVRINE